LVFTNWDKKSKEKNNMPHAFPRRRLKIREVMKREGIKYEVRRLAKSLNLVESQNPEMDLNYFNMSIPMMLSDEEITERLSAVADTVIDIEDSDVILLGMWVSPQT
jgi:hypothetical protein